MIDARYWEVFLLGIFTTFFPVFSFFFHDLKVSSIQNVCYREVSLNLGKKQRVHLKSFSISTIAFPTLILSTYALYKCTQHSYGSLIFFSKKLYKTKGKCITKIFLLTLSKKARPCLRT